MGKLFLLFTIVIFASCAAATSPYKRPPFPAIPTTGTRYMVKKGDSLWKISKRYGVNINTLMKVNKISSPGNLSIGQTIIIPSSLGRVNKGFFSWPLEGEVVNYFGETVDNSINRGLNIQANPSAKNVTAAAYGKVVFAGQLKSWGYTVILQHDTEHYTIYANLEPSSMREGATVGKKQAIGQVASGKNGNQILHFEIRKRYIPQDPLQYLN